MATEYGTVLSTPLLSLWWTFPNSELLSFLKLILFFCRREDLSCRCCNCFLQPSVGLYMMTMIIWASIQMINFSLMNRWVITISHVYRYSQLSFKYKKMFSSFGELNFPTKVIFLFTVPNNIAHAYLVLFWVLKLECNPWHLSCFMHFSVIVHPHPEIHTNASWKIASNRLQSLNWLLFSWQGGRQCSLQLLIQLLICAPGTRYSWVDRGSVEHEVYPTHDRCWECNSRPFDLESNTLST